MIKLLVRFFLLCIFFTVVIGALLYYVNVGMDSKNDEGNFRLLSQGLFASLDNYLAPYPTKEWQFRIDHDRPEGAVGVKIVPLSSLSLNKKQVEKIRNNEMVYVLDQLNPYHALVIYQLTRNHDYVYEYSSYPDTIFWVKLMFGWSIKQILLNLQHLPTAAWPGYLKQVSAQHGFPISVISIKNSKLKPAQINRLVHHEIVVDFPTGDAESVQVFYIPFPHGDNALQFGPIVLPFLGTYKKPIIFILSLVVLELIVFILAILFARTLEKLKNLANDFGQSRFDSQVKISKTSTLYPLFTNLKLMGARIKNLLESHKDLTNSISHELRTPISRLRFTLELIKDAKDQQEVHQRLQTMETDIGELEDLVSEILTYSQLDRLEININETLCLNNLVALVLKKLEKNNHKEINNQLTIMAPVMISGNERYLLRALQNIIQNAIKHAHELIKISIHPAQPNQLIIEDDGLGIAEEDREKIFEPFVQLANQPPNIPAGYGLGLAITKKIIDQHGWKILVLDSDLGGAKIIIQFLQ